MLESTQADLDSNEVVATCDSHTDDVADFVAANSLNCLICKRATACNQSAPRIRFLGLGGRMTTTPCDPYTNFRKTRISQPYWTFLTAAGEFSRVSVRNHTEVRRSRIAH